LALGLATLTQRFVEEPLRRKGSRTNVAPLSAGWTVAATCVALLIAHGVLGAARARASTPAQRPFLAARADGMQHDCWGSLLENATAPCIFGDVNATTSVALLGDSHAEHWLPAVDRIGRARHWKVYAMVKPACPVPDMPELVSARLKRSYVECTDWRRSMLQRIVAIHPDAVILSSYDHYMPADGSASAWQVTPELWRRGLRRTYALLSGAGLNTVVIRGTPQPDFDVPACLSRRASRAPFQFRDCDYALGESLSPVAIAAQNDAARGLSGIAFVDMNDQFCARNGHCAPVQRGAIVFRDDDHITATFSRATAPVLGDRIERAVRALNRR